MEISLFYEKPIPEYFLNAAFGNFY